MFVPNINKIHQSPISTFLHNASQASIGMLRCLAWRIFGLIFGTAIITILYMTKTVSMLTKIINQNQMKMYVFSLTMFRGRMQMLSCFWMLPEGPVLNEI